MILRYEDIQIESEEVYLERKGEDGWVNRLTNTLLEMKHWEYDTLYQEFNFGCKVIKTTIRRFLRKNTDLVYTVYTNDYSNSVWVRIYPRKRNWLMHQIKRFFRIN